MRDARNVALSRAVVDHIRNLRKARGLTQAQLSGSLAAAGYPTTWAMVEHRPGAALTIDQAYVVAFALGVSLGDLVDGALSQVCATCSDTPPCGFTCNACGRVG